MKFSEIIVCDDIRREEGNKRTIVGAYAGKILFHPSQLPIQGQIFKPLGFYFKITKEEGDSDIDSFKGSIFHTSKGQSKEEAKKLGSIEGNINVTNYSVITIDLVLPLNLPGEGNLYLGFQVFKQKKLIEEIFRELIDIEIQAQPQPQTVGKN